MSSQSSRFDQLGSPTVVELTGAVCATLRPLPDWMPNTCVPMRHRLSLRPREQENSAPTELATGTDIQTRHVPYKQELFHEHCSSGKGLSAYDRICAEAEGEQFYLQHVIVDEVEHLDRKQSSMRDGAEQSRDSENEREDLENFSALAWWSEVAANVELDKRHKHLMISDSQSAASLTVVDSDLVLSMQPVLADDGSRDGGSPISKSRKSSACIVIGQEKHAPGALPISNIIKHRLLK
ncbi:hypothetical protein NliqN6_6851 [Naganishia liquefaciens]|uniref:Uncharacterized protein n=1 Tax=Naganishia liquefaciens TaxID=104408 RepID=A0A8H3U0F3_9TREE|nr:hypothetical protein NliqN6_6851 [Naganishia liquefaciens]